MPKYKMRFVIETPLRGDEDVEFHYRGHTLKFLFRSGINAAKNVELEVTCESENYNQAIALASNELIPPVLDAIAFHRKTQLLLGDFSQITKAESGLARRKIILKDFRRYEEAPLFHKTWTGEVQQIIDADPELRRLSLRWLRNTYRRLSIPDGFIYAWLALENLAGERQVRKQCQNCRAQQPPYTAADRDAAYGIISAIHPEVTQRTFSDWWGRLRNSLFHGGHEPDAQFFHELYTTTETIVSAVERTLCSRLRLPGRPRPAQPIVGQRGEVVWCFLEFDAPSPDEEFPSQIPSMSRLIELMEGGRPVQEEMGCCNIAHQAFAAW